MRPLEVQHILNCGGSKPGRRQEKYKPGIKKRPIQEAAVVVIAHKVPHLRLPHAGLGNDLISDRDSVSGVMKVQQDHIKHQRRLSWDVAT